jgi:hypothetical protein
MFELGFPKTDSITSITLALYSCELAIKCLRFEYCLQYQKKDTIHKKAVVDQRSETFCVPNTAQKIKPFNMF